MKEKELAKFVDWLVQSGETPEGASFDETVSWINELATSEEGQQILGRLIQTYKNKEMGIFKEGGKLNYLLCLKKGGAIQDCGCGKKIEKNQPGGSIASRIWNRLTGNDTYVDGGGQIRHYAPVRESAHRVIKRAADSPLVQAIPVVGDLADGYVAADYAAKGNYKPALAAIGAGLILPNAMEVGARMVPSSTYRNIANKADDFVEVLGVEKPSRWNRTSDKKFNAVEDNSNRWIPETQYDDDLNVIAGSLDDSMSSEPWWGWDPVEYKKGGEISRKYALGALRATGSGNAESRQEYREKKREARESGLRGMDAINAARQSAIDKAMWRITPVLSDEVEIDNYNVELSPEIRNLAPQELGVSIQGYNEHMGDKRFGDAFRRARKYGLKEFEWNGKRYNTNLRGPETAETAKIVTSETPSIPVYIPENKKSLIENLKAAIINNAPYMK